MGASTYQVTSNINAFSSYQCNFQQISEDKCCLKDRLHFVLTLPCLSDSALMKDGTVIMGVISDMLRKHKYSEFNGSQGSMIGASFDWRLMPQQLERRDEYFTDLLTQTEAMVAADPLHRPAVVIGFSLGCRIGKYSETE